ncbi:MAG: trypsin-like peptidase domain-containing protein [Acidobacteria bacterium]|nr:trypsin-like peptidase domain-containing protein [Acidobacteriota bacterium]
MNLSSWHIPPVRRTGSRRSIRPAVIGLLVMLGLSTAVMAQISQGGTPYSFQKNLTSPVDTITLPRVDTQALLAEDEVEATLGLPFRFGYPHEVDLGLDNAGTWEELPDGGLLWRLRLVCPDAYSINLIFSEYDLPAGAALFLYDDENRTLLGSFTRRNNKAHGQFATAPTCGETCILEYYEPPTAEQPGRLAIARVVHGYKNVFFGTTEKGFGDSGACNINVNCPEGDDWRDQINSAGMITLGGGTRLCSGALVNNVRQDETPYFLTANHCLIGDVSTWVIIFNYQSPSCTNINGSTADSIAGTTLVASNAASDFALLRLSETPPPDYNPFYSGWSAVDTPAATTVAIHHPSGDIKKISFENDPVTSSDYEPSPYLVNSHWKVWDWDLGTTEGGSSGSPLYDPSKRIVGQLHGGYAACGNDLPDYYGKFAMSWNRGGSPTTRLRDWLDPDNTGVLTLDGFGPGTGLPTVTITSPAPLSIVSGIVTIAATATDDQGISQVEFFINNIPLGTDTTPPYQQVWDTSGYADGQHQIKATATNLSSGQRSTTITVVKSDAGYAIVVVDLASDNQSGTKMIDSLNALGYPAVQGDSITSLDPAQYPLMFVCLGYYSGNYELTAADGTRLQAYLDAGGALYMEGGDTWYYDDPTAVHPYFGIEGLSDGTVENDLGTVTGQAGTPTAGISFAAEGVVTWVDRLGITPGVTDATVIWRSQTNSYSCGIARDHGTYKTIGTSFEFGNIPAGMHGQVMQAYLNFFDITQSMTPSYLAHFASSAGQWATELTLFNAAAAAAGVALTVFAENGQIQATESLDIPGKGIFSSSIAELFPTLAVESGWIRIESGSAEVKGIIRFTDLLTQASSSLPTTYAAGRRLALPLIENSADWESGLAVVNITDKLVTLTVKAYAPDGTLLQQVSLPSLAGYGKYVRMADDVFTVPLPDQVALVVESSANITGFALSLKSDGSNIVAVPADILPDIP